MLKTCAILLLVFLMREADSQKTRNVRNFGYETAPDSKYESLMIRGKNCDPKPDRPGLLGDSACMDCATPVAINAGLVVCMPFNGDATDQAGMDNNGTIIGATLTNDRFGNANNAYSFNGTSDYIDGTITQQLLANEYTYSAWIKFNALPPVASFLSFISIGGPVLDQAMGYRNIPGSVGFAASSYNIMGSSNRAESAIVPVAGAWYHLVSTRDNTSLKLYINGILAVSSPTGVNAGYDPSNTLHIGARNELSDYGINGTIDDIRIYNRVLDANEINQVYSQTNCNNIINSYTPVFALEPCANKFTVGDASAFNTGDTVLLIQMKGAIIDSSNTSAFGTITDYKNAGNYEFNYIKNKLGNVIELKNQLTRQYDIPNGKVQLVRVPHYQSLNVTSTLTCLPWDGNKGGILVLNVRDTITLNADIDISGKGFKGGAAYPGGQYQCDIDSFYIISTNGTDGASKGEGIFLNTSLLNGRGKDANGGGGGNSVNSGGAGGGNGGNGGEGGKEWAGCNNNFINGGIGGRSLNYNNALNRIFLGGGGGAGQMNDFQLSGGGKGGGIAIITTNSLKSNSYKIKSEGETPIHIIGHADDGRSGGGAGGTILINYLNLIDPASLSAKGGNGDNCIATPDWYHGPGGGGGGGIIWTNKSVNDLLLITTTTGGIPGANINIGNNPWGATPGQSGSTLFNLSIPIDNVPFVTGVISSLLTIAICHGQNYAGYTTSGTYIDTLISVYGCDSIRTLILTVEPGYFSSITQTICSGQTYSGYSVSGTYIDTFVASNDCDSVRTINLTVKPQSFSTITQSVCDGQNFAGYAASGTYIDTFVAANGCDSIRTIHLSVLPLIQPHLGVDTVLCTGDSLRLYPGLFNTYNWQNGSTQNSIIVKQGGLYSVTVTDNCHSTRDEIMITENACDIYFPSAFTPNNDGKNDWFKILGGLNLKEYHLIVYNRWGQKVFETSDLTKGWDGILNGQLQPTAAFVWYCEFKKPGDANKTKMKGLVTLVK